MVTKYGYFSLNFIEYFDIFCGASDGRLLL